jgi:pimeloyl-ACP methyl ester carboxylesterase
MTSQITLANGRALAWAEYGAPTGMPMIYCHGFPGSRLEAGFADAAALDAGVRIIAVDRPGFGMSDYYRARGILDWPRDVRELADGLGVESFFVLGVSGGAPYALACALQLPERVRSTTIVSPLGPIEMLHDGAGMAAISRFGLRIAGRAPGMATPLSAILQPVVRHAGWLALAFVAASASEPDRQTLRDPAFRNILATSMSEAFRYGFRGVAKELMLISAPWQFDPGDVTAPVTIWQGDMDRVVPASMGRALERRLHAARAIYLTGEGHYSLVSRHVGEILSQAIA